MKPTSIYRLEYAAFRILFSCFRVLPLDFASWLGGWLARCIGPQLNAHQVARKNIARFLPEKTEAQRKKIIRGMWDNLGRTAAELSHHHTQEVNNRVEKKGADYLRDLVGRQPIFFSAHLGNWELTYPMGEHAGIPLMLIYRKINNPYIENYIANIRQTHCHDLVAKGPRNVFKMMRGLKKQQYSLALLIDQKMNDGIAVPFFGVPAMTAPAIADIALSYNLPIIPTRIIRTKGAHFRGEVCAPMTFEKTGNDEQDIMTIMTAINHILEDWIREYPSQWFWVHRRWPSEVKEDAKPD